MLIIEKLDGIFVEEYRLRLSKSNAMLARVITAFCTVPFESQLRHNYSVGMK